MRKALLYFWLYRLLDLEAILWSITDAVRHYRAGIAMRLSDLTHSR